MRANSKKNSNPKLEEKQHTPDLPDDAETI
jgi:hypothetical protein